MKRVMRYAENLAESVDLEAMEEVPLYDRERTSDFKGANLVSSLLENGKHAPVLDLDVHHKLVPSSTEGHGHLYIDVECEWDDYVNLLDAMSKCGILEESYVEFSKRRGASFVRKPGTYKEGSRSESIYAPD